MLSLCAGHCAVLKQITDEQDANLACEIMD